MDKNINKVGIIGGIGPASTLDYYNDIINGYREKIKRDEYPQIVIDSIDMTEMLGYLQEKNYEGLILMLLQSINNLAAAGANFAAIASNTPHIVFKEVEKKSVLPLISIVEETCKYTKNIGCKKVVVFGTQFTMNSGLYAKSMEQYGIESVTPNKEEQNAIHSIIFPNLENGIILPEEKKKMVNIANNLIEVNSADALLLGCTELPLMIKENDIHTTLLNTTQIHIEAIIQKLIQS